MPLWNVTDTANNSAKPNWTDTGPRHVNKVDVYANDSGWIHGLPSYTDSSGNTRNKTEILVAVRGLSSNVSRLAAATVTDIRFAGASIEINSVSNVIVTFNEQVTVTGAPRISLSVANTTSNTVFEFPHYATYAAGSGTNRLYFNFTAQSNSAAYTVGDQDIDLNSGTIVDVVTSTTSGLQLHPYRTGANSAVTAAGVDTL